MSVHFHPSYANLLAVGCYDGSVAVYDARSKSGAPLYHATVKSGKHNDAVWQVGRAKNSSALLKPCSHHLCSQINPVSP